LLANDTADSHVSKCKAATVVNKNAYILFYRRRQAGPLGPPSLQKLVSEAKAPATDPAESEPEDSRNTSPSGAGNGERLDGQYSLNGSSSASAVAGVDRLSHGGLGSAGVTAGSLLATQNNEDDPDDPLPSMEDEGIGMGDEDMQVLGPSNYLDHDWSWPANMTAGAFDANKSDDAMNDAASDVAASGGSEVENKLMEDFGDEFGSARAGAGTPEIHSLAGDTPDLQNVGPDVMGMTAMDDQPAVEIRLDEDEHVKSD